MYVYMRAAVLTHVNNSRFLNDTEAISLLPNDSCQLNATTIKAGLL